MKYLIRKILKEEVSERLKKIVKNKLTKELSHSKIDFDKETEMIRVTDSEDDLTYFEVDELGNLFYNVGYYENLFRMFSIRIEEFETIIKEFAEDLLKRKIYSASFLMRGFYPM